MKLKWIVPALSACIFSAAQAVQAGDIAFGVKASTLGISGEVVTNVVPMLLNARLQLNGFNYNTTIKDTSVTYDAKLKLSSAGALVDLYPFAGKFRITGGVYYNANKLDLKGTPNTAQSFVINGTTYTVGNIGSVNSQITFNKFAPYLGIGWGDSISSGSPVGISFEVGALYQGVAKSTVTTSKTLVGAAGALLAANVAAEKAKLDNALNRMKVYPVVSLGVNYAF